MNNTTHTIPIARITPSSITLYHLSTENYTRTHKQIENEKNLTRGLFNGYMSPKTKSKVKRYLDTWIEAVNQIKKSPEAKYLEKVPYLTFVTLTLPSTQKHDDNKIKRLCLTPFIETLKRKFNVWNYFWRAEAQENGNIHFHLIIDSYIHHEKLRNEWNICINKLNYVDEFEAKFGHRNPNSTDINSLKNVRSVSAYVIKYCCKSDGYREIKGRIHGCSDSIRKLMPYEIIIEAEDYDMIEKAIEGEKFYIRQDDCFTYIQMKVQSFLKRINSPHLGKMMDNYKKIGAELYTKNTVHPTNYLQAGKEPILELAPLEKTQREETDELIQFRIMEWDKY